MRAGKGPIQFHVCWWQPSQPSFLHLGWCLRWRLCDWLWWVTATIYSDWMAVGGHLAREGGSNRTGLKRSRGNIAGSSGMIFPAIFCPVGGQAPASRRFPHSPVPLPVRLAHEEALPECSVDSDIVDAWLLQGMLALVYTLKVSLTIH
jgi:hypothetical protein